MIAYNDVLDELQDYILDENNIQKSLKMKIVRSENEKQLKIKSLGINGATNIYKIAYNAVNNKERPNYLSRSKNTSTGLDEPVKSKFTCLEIGEPC